MNNNNIPVKSINIGAVNLLSVSKPVVAKLKNQRMFQNKADLNHIFVYITTCQDVFKANLVTI